MERDLDDEVRSYLELLTEEKAKSGMSEADARRAARIELGGLEQVKENVRDLRWGATIDSVIRDFRHSLRAMRKNPGLTITAIFSLSIGIGVNTAIFTLIDRIALRPLPIADPDRVVVFREQAATSTFYPHSIYNLLRDRNQAFSGLLATRPARFHVSSGEGSERVEGEVVSGNYFEVLGVKAALGRTIGPEDDRAPDGHPVAVLSYQFWQRRYHGDPQAIGKEIRVNGRKFTIIGVSPAGFFGLSVGRASDIRIPMTMIRTAIPWWTARDDESRSFFVVVGRLKEGISASQAEASINPLVQAIYSERFRARGRPRTGRPAWMNWRIVFDPAHMGYSRVRNQFSRPLQVLMTASGLVLLIACANLAGLLVSRAVARTREIAIRLAIGAGRGVLVRQMMIEALLIAGAGGIAGTLLAWLTLDYLVSLLPAMIDSARLDLELDYRILGFATAVSLIAAALIGLIPALQSSRVDIRTMFQGNAGVVRGWGFAFSVRKTLIVFQVAFSVVLLAGAGLFLRTFRSVYGQEMGMDRMALIHINVNPRLSGYTAEGSSKFHTELIRRLKALPSVASVAPTDFGVVFQGETNGANVLVREGDEPEQVNADWVGSSFFDTLGIPLLRGRTWTDAEAAQSPTRVAVINQAFANRFFPGANPMGQRIALQRRGPFQTEIIGVAADNKYVHLRELAAPFIYLPIPLSEIATRDPIVYARVKGDARGSIGEIRREIRAMDLALPLPEVQTLDDRQYQSLAQERLVAWLSSAFGLIATVLASIGLYGVIAYSVIRRTREIGVRMALGAGRGNVFSMVLRESLWLVGLGVALGVPAAGMLARLVRGLLFGVSPGDPTVLAGAAITMTAAATCAAWLPAQRAVRIDPLEALRQD